jgi:hypothetical protein
MKSLKICPKSKKNIFQIDKSNHTALTTALRLSRWHIAKELLTNVGLKTGDPLQVSILSIAISAEKFSDKLDNPGCRCGAADSDKKINEMKTKRSRLRSPARPGQTLLKSNNYVSDDYG